MRALLLICLLSCQEIMTGAQDTKGDQGTSTTQYKCWVPGWIFSILWNHPITYQGETWTIGQWHEYLTSWSWEEYAAYNARFTRWSYEEWLEFFSRHEGSWSGFVWSLYELGFRSLGQVARLANEVIIDRLAERLRRSRV